MNVRVVLQRMFMVTLALALAVPLVASPARVNSTTSSAKTSITLPSSANFGGTTLKAGEYQVVADGTKVTIKQKGKVVAEANAEWADAKAKYDSSGVVIDGNDIRAIRFGGKSRYVVIR